MAKTASASPIVTFLCQDRETTLGRFHQATTHLESEQQKSAATDAHARTDKSSHPGQDPSRGDQRERIMIPGRRGA